MNTLCYLIRKINADLKKLIVMKYNLIVLHSKFDSIMENFNIESTTSFLFNKLMYLFSKAQFLDRRI